MGVLYFEVIGNLTMTSKVEQTGDADERTPQYSDSSETGQRSGKGSGFLSSLLF
jgi:hypothetical protein